MKASMKGAIERAMAGTTVDAAVEINAPRAAARQDAHAGATTRIAVLLACHNRREKTLAALAALHANALPQGVGIEVFLTDDGSTDGTAEAVRERFPATRILRGDGSLFWNGAMRKAFGAALELRFDAYLWLNDDTMLYPDTLAGLVATWRERRAAEGRDAIIVGSTQDETTKGLTYGGVVRHSWVRPMTFDMVTPGSAPIACESMWGNCVLIPRAITERIGNLESRFTHSMGDMDYGLRARKAGFSIWTIPGYAGTCSMNSNRGTYHDPALPLAERLKKMRTPKGLPFGQWALLTRRWGGPLWPLYWAWPYARVVLSSVMHRGG